MLSCCRRLVVLSWNGVPMKRFLSLLLAAVLCCWSLPAYAEEPAPAQGGSPTVGSSEDAKTVEELLQAGDYAPGCVLARVTDEYAPISTFSNDASGTSYKSLYDFGSSSEAVPQARNGLSVSAVPSSDQVILIESATLSTEELLLSLVGQPGVVLAEPDYVTTRAEPIESDSEDASSGSEAATAALLESVPATNDPMLDQQWHLSSNETVPGAANVFGAWEQAGVPDSSDSLKQVVVAVVDDGVTYSHPDLKNVMWENNQSVTGLPGTHGYDFAENDDDPDGPGGHGTHVAGIIAAEINNGVGGAGIAPNVKIMALRVFDDNDAMRNSSAISSYGYIETAIEAGVPVVAANNSWGGPGSITLLTSVMEDLYESKGVVSFCASGNESLNGDLSMTGPAGSFGEGVVTVDALEEGGDLAYYSNYGAMTTDIAAPGTGIWSTVPDPQGTVALEDADKAVVLDELEETQGLFTVSVEGTASSTLEWDSYLKLSVSNAQVDQDVSLVLSSTNGAVRQAMSNAGKSLDDVRYFAFTAGSYNSSEDGSALIMHASVRSTDPNNPWIEVTSGDSRCAIRYGEPATVAVPLSDEVRSQIDWENFSVKITRAFVSEYDAGLNFEFYFDNAALAWETSPYAFMSGTSMATPAVTGSYALLAGMYPEEDASTLRARLLGGVKRSEALAGSCTTDGALDVVRAMENPYPVVDALDSVDGTLEATVRGSWFGDGEGSVTLDGEPLTVTSWSANQIQVVLPASLESAARYVEVQRAADGETGRRLVVVGSEEEGAFYESLPAPDLESLGLRIESRSEPWQLEAAAGKLYASSLSLIDDEVTDDDVTSDDDSYFTGLLVYDPASATWSREQTLGDLGESFRLASHDDMLYLLGDESGLLYRFDAAAGALVGDPLDCGEALQEAGIDYSTGYSSAASDGHWLWLAGGVDLSTYNVADATVRVDMETGEVQNLAPLEIPRFSPAVEVVSGVPMVAAGDGLVTADQMVPTVEQYVGEAWERIYLPETVELVQSGLVASGVVPANAKVSGTSAPNDRLILAGLNGSSLADPDTYVYDPVAGTWQPVAERLSASKVTFAGGAVLDGSFYVLATDLVTDTTIFKRLSFEMAPEPEGGEPGGEEQKPEGEEPGGGEQKPGAEQEQTGRQPSKDDPTALPGATPKALVSTGDPLNVAVAALAVLAVAGLGVVVFAKMRSRRRARR